MEEEKPQFDSNVGGSEKVPMYVRLQEFTKHRIEEILMLTESLKESPFKGQAFQRLPKHMRRRQMSHNLKRLPRRLQNVSISTTKEVVPATPKRPSRKFRRRPSNLLLEYNRRQKKNIWLETHIWHAKRFHIINKWGYKLPFKPVDKSFRACYRASAQHCLITDISYYNVIELQGPENILLDNLQKCVSTECGLTFKSKMYINGLREGSVTIYQPNSYPYKVIGNVNFLWKPKEEENPTRFLWIWVHPLMHDEVVECFRDLFQLLKESKTEEVKEPEPFKKENIEKIKLETKNVPFERVPKYKNEKTLVSMALLKDTLNRFSLTGPLSQAIISQSFQVCSVKLPVNNQADMDSNNDVEIVEIKNNGLKTLKRSREDNENESIRKKLKTETDNWWNEFYTSEKEFNCWEKQSNFYNSLKEYSNPTDLPPKMVLSVVLRDPRLTVPRKRIKCVPDKAQENKYVETIEPELCQSPLWNSNVRDEVSTSKFTTDEINKAKSKLIVPGCDVGEFINGKHQSRVPVLLIQKPGENSPEGRLGYGCGWDIVTPANYAMPFWLSLILRGARSGGLRDTETLLLESSNLSRALQPDTSSGQKERSERSQELKEKYFRLPPNKRPNFIKLGTVSPFYFPWEILVRDWIGKIRTEFAEEIENEEKFFVLRNKKILKELRDAAQSVKNRKELNLKYEKYLEEINSIIEISIECNGKGKPSEFGMICIPTVKDLEIYKSNGLAPVEPIHDDTNFTDRKKLKQEHSKHLKALRRKRKKEKLELVEKIQNQPLGVKLSKKLLEKRKPENDPALKKVSYEYNKKMEELWLPENFKNVADSASRTIFGFVTKGDFSFSKAEGFGLGYVSLAGLLHLLNSSKGELVVLVRNPDQVQYRFAKLKIL